MLINIAWYDKRNLKIIYGMGVEEKNLRKVVEYRNIKVGL